MDFHFTCFRAIIGFIMVVLIHAAQVNHDDDDPEAHSGRQEDELFWQATLVGDGDSPTQFHHNLQDRTRIYFRRDYPFAPKTEGRFPEDSSPDYPRANLQPPANWITWAEGILRDKESGYALYWPSPVSRDGPFREHVSKIYREPSRDEMRRWLGMDESKANEIIKAHPRAPANSQQPSLIREALTNRIKFLHLVAQRGVIRFVNWDYQMTQTHPRGPLARQTPWSDQDQTVNIARQFGDPFIDTTLGFPGCGHLRYYDPATDNEPWRPGRLTMDGTQAARPVKIRITSQHPWSRLPNSNTPSTPMVQVNNPNSIARWLDEYDDRGAGTPAKGARVWRDLHHSIHLNPRDVWFPWSIALFHPSESMEFVESGEDEVDIGPVDAAIHWNFHCTGSIIGAKWFVALAHANQPLECQPQIVSRPVQVHHGQSLCHSS